MFCLVTVLLKNDSCLAVFFKVVKGSTINIKGESEGVMVCICSRGVLAR